MKIFTVKRVLGLAAIYGVVRYARKQGGFGKMLEGLTTKGNAREAQADDTLGSVTRTANTGTRSTTPVTSSGFGGSYSGGSGSDGFGGGSNRH
jgi:hypothetical protein